MSLSLYTRKAFLKTFTPVVQCQRFRGKINVQRPKPPHFEKATYLALAKPWFINPKKSKTSLELCNYNQKFNNDENEINQYSKILAKELYAYFSSSKLIVFYHHNSLTADEQFKYYSMFKKQNMDLKKFGKKVLKLAVSGTPYETVLDFYSTPNNMILFSPETEIAKVLKITKKCSQLVLLTAIVENKLLTTEDLAKYSKIPNIQAAQAELLHLTYSIGNNLVTNLNSHQTNLASQLDTRIKQLQEDDE